MLYSSGLAKPKLYNLIHWVPGFILHNEFTFCTFFLTFSIDSWDSLTHARARLSQKLQSLQFRRGSKRVEPS